MNILFSWYAYLEITILFMKARVTLFEAGGPKLYGSMGVTFTTSP